MTKVRIFVTYKQSVFDPQRETITEAVHSLGHDEVKEIKVGKFFDVTIDSKEKEVEESVKEISEQLLVNFNLETYRYEIMEED
ncbi:phosphoribosylformylglycinamidine synthase subunit PurS [Ligilactobacillus salivarius]|uniref:phosphoribosylformylglycinamidine synthase subunit PurS n=1 Tax=Ligilactobacillus salivarius TaxID=1624 RepID=UPI0024BA666D|nr:phosphoribosylformylglycinamidine synthase subunit PurS [Ligilactobacillus salivarius]WHS10523.1 phosphoribosylformylglycinamidine synthase subunit PurS [Ligilactobacillus salivarius]